MIKKISDINLDKLLKNPSKASLLLLDQVLSFVIPFNSPHSFKLMVMEQGQVSAKLPYKRKNLNHLKGIHACAIATIGEFCAGLNLIRNFPIKEFRPILAELKCEYLYQGKTDLTATNFLEEKDVKHFKETIEKEGKAFIDMITIVVDKEQKEVAKVHTRWQIKSWSKVKTKI